MVNVYAQCMIEQLVKDYFSADARPLVITLKKRCSSVETYDPENGFVRTPIGGLVSTVNDILQKDEKIPRVVRRGMANVALHEVLTILGYTVQRTVEFPTSDRIVRHQ